MTKAVCVVRAPGAEDPNTMKTQAIVLAAASSLVGVQVVSAYYSTSQDALSDADVDAVIALMTEAGSNRIVMWNVLELADTHARKRLDAILDRLPKDTRLHMMER